MRVIDRRGVHIPLDKFLEERLITWPSRPEPEPCRQPYSAHLQRSGDRLEVLTTRLAPVIFPSAPNVALHADHLRSIIE